MKKGLLVVAALGLLVAVSCKKDHTCSCTLEGGGLSITADTVFTDSKKKDAKTSCEALNSSVTLGGDTFTTTCELK